MNILVTYSFPENLKNTNKKEVHTKKAEIQTFLNNKLILAIPKTIRTRSWASLLGVPWIYTIPNKQAPIINFLPMSERLNFKLMS